MARSRPGAVEPTVYQHVKDIKHGLERFRKAVGSIPAEGPRPSKTFLDDRIERRLAERASD